MSSPATPYNSMVLAGSSGKTFAASRIMLPPTLEYASSAVHAFDDKPRFPEQSTILAIRIPYAVLTVCALIQPDIARSEAWPTKPVRRIQSSAPGSSAGIIGRILTIASAPSGVFRS
jgi:hypothetical protein